jgi:hypothetical protein
MSIEISDDIAAARLQVVLDKLNAGAGPARLQLYAGLRTTLSAPVTATLITDVALAEPSGTIEEGELTLGTAAENSMNVATGTPTWGLFINGSGAPCLSVPVVVLAPGDPVVDGALCLLVPVLYEGGQVHPLEFKIG